MWKIKEVIDMNKKVLFALPIIFIAFSMLAVPAMAVIVLDMEFIAEGKAVVFVNGVKSAGRAQFNVDLTGVLSVKMGFGDPAPEEGPEDWLYGWAITYVRPVCNGYVVRAVPSDIEMTDGAEPAPWPIKILITKIEEGRLVMAWGCGFSFVGRIIELEAVGI
jgi:hypothetical protein